VVRVGGVAIGNLLPFVLIAGPCQIESVGHALEVAAALDEICTAAEVPLIYKSSYDKANRTSAGSARGVGMKRGLAILAQVRERYARPVLTDVHGAEQCAPAAEAVDVLQIPAFLCRQTDLLVAAGETGRVINVKKGQFLAPWDMKHVVAKALSVGNANVMACERGFCFGYNNLVSDMRSLSVLRETGAPVVFDATHSVQLPGGQGTSSGGQREFIPVLARAAVAAGVAGIFMETHPRPEEALSDGPNAWPLARMEPLLATLVELDRAVKKSPFEESLL